MVTIEYFNGDKWDCLEHSGDWQYWRRGKRYCLGCLRDAVEKKKSTPPPNKKRNPARCHECGRFVSKKELSKVPVNGVPWCDDCVSACDSIWD